jgi:hypothetical protein
VWREVRREERREEPGLEGESASDPVGGGWRRLAAWRRSEGAEGGAAADGRVWRSGGMGATAGARRWRRARARDQTTRLPERDGREEEKDGAKRPKAAARASLSSSSSLSLFLSLSWPRLS